jgi:hypothetical protein
MSRHKKSLRFVTNLPRFDRTAAAEPWHCFPPSRSWRWIVFLHTPQAEAIRRQPFWASLPMKLSAYISALLVLLASPLALAQDLPEQLYKAEVIVTGKGEEERARGFREGLKEIFIKLSGDPAIASGDKLAPYLSGAGSFIREYTYEDRMKHLPVRDEQGTRDRPHFLRMTADAEKTEAAIKSLGFEIWRGRPEIDVYLTVQDPRRTFIVGAETAKPAAIQPLPIPIASDRYDGYEQREVVKSIGIHRGLALNLPDVTRLENQPGDTSISKLTMPLLLFSGHPHTSAPAHYRGYLTALPSGGWKLTAMTWESFSLHTLAYKEDTSCFSFEVTDPSFDTALKESFDAFAAWLRRDKDAPLCGLPKKF